MDHLSSTAVIVTYHNEGNKLLHRSLLSIEDQTYRGPIEVVVVDDCSTILPSLPSNQKIPAKIIRSTRNIKLPAARNLGFSKTNADFITFLDADDVFLKNRIKDHVDFLVNRPHLIFSGGGGIINRFGKIWRHWPPFVEELIRQEMLRTNQVLPLLASRNICLKYGFHSCGFTVRRHHFQKVGGFDPSLRWGEEWDLQIRLAQLGSIGYVAEPGYEYIQREGSITQDQNPWKHQSMADLYSKILLTRKDFSTAEIREIKRKRSNALLLAGQIYFERTHNSKNAWNCAARALFGAPSIWALRSLVRYSLNWITGSKVFSR